MTRRATHLVAFIALSALAPSLLLAQEFMQWTGNFPAISLPDITSRTTVSTGSSTTTLQLNGDAEISADNSATAQLSEGGGDALVTEYKITFDGNGGSATGGATVDYTPYDSFLAPAAQITHVLGDDNVDVTLYVRVQNPPGDVADAGAYSAAQTLTAHWTGL